MPSVPTSAILLAVALAASAAAAQQPELRTELELALGRQTRAPTVPPELRPLVREASRERVVVRSLGGADIAVDLNDREAETLMSFGGGRFVGFSYVGYEYFGFTLIDRAASGEAALLDTGERPVFSADGRYFATAVITEDGYGETEGITVWEVLRDRVARRFYTDAMPRGIDWRVDGWPRPDCAAISAVNYAWQPPPDIDYGEAILTAPRMQFQIELDEEGAALTSSVATAVCGVVPAE